MRCSRSRPTPATSARPRAHVSGSARGGAGLRQRERGGAAAGGDRLRRADDGRPPRRLRAARPVVHRDRRARTRDHALESCLEEVEREDPENVAAYVRFAGYLSAALTDLGQLERAESVLTNALDRAENAADVYTRIRVYWSIARLSEAGGHRARGSSCARRSLCWKRPTTPSISARRTCCARGSWGWRTAPTTHCPTSSVPRPLRSEHRPRRHRAPADRAGEERRGARFRRRGRALRARGAQPARRRPPGRAGERAVGARRSARAEG